MHSNKERIIDVCGNCQQRVDASENEPFTLVECPGCGVPMRVRAYFHHFEIVEQIGTGGMSRVFRARDASLGRDVALKILNKECSQDEKRARQFEKEAEITARIGHPNVVRVYTAGRDQGHFYIAMELVGGGSLEGGLRQKGKFKEAQVLELAAQTVLGLKAAHDAGLIHRDIKPGNILLAEDGTPKIVDFGLALFARDADGSGEIWATPYYVPPETLHHAAEDFRSDIYSLGATLYHLLLGKPPCDKDTSSLEELKRLKAIPIHVKPAVAKLSSETCDMLERSMAIKQADRYKSYELFLDHLRFAQRRLRRGGKGRPWPGRVQKGVAPWKRAAAAAVAIAAGAGIFAALQKPPPLVSAGDAQGSLFTDAEPTIGSDSSTSSRFLAARDAMLARDFGKARQLFEEIGGNPATQQPTRNWARWNAGLCAFLMQDAAGAKKLYGALAAEPPYSSGAKEAELAGFFTNTARWLAAPGISPGSFRSDCPRDSVRAIGLLAAGLKNWEAGDAGAAGEALRAFFQSNPPKPAGEWVDNSRKLATPLLADIAALESMPPPDVDKLNAVEADAALATARSILEKITSTGPVVDEAKAAAELLASNVKKRKQQLAMQDGGGRDIDVSAEFKLVHDTAAACSPMGTGLRFSEAAARLRAVTVSSTEAIALREAHARSWEQAAEFVTQLLSDLSRYHVEGTMDDAKGLPVRTLFSAAGDSLNARPAQGPVQKLPPAKVPAWQLFAFGKELLGRVQDSDEYYRRSQQLYFFALHAGLKITAGDMAASLERECPPFRQQLALMNTVSITTSTATGESSLK